MCISPVSEFLFEAQIFSCYIESAYVSYAVVYNNQFPVVSVVKPHKEDFHLGPEEKRTFNSCIHKRLYSPLCNLSASESIHKKPYLNAFFCFLFEGLEESDPNLIPFDDIVFDIDAFFGVFDVCNQTFEFLSAVCKKLYLIVLSEICTVISLIESDHISPFGSFFINKLVFAC